MSTKQPHSVDAAIRAWELYSAEKYNELIGMEKGGSIPEIHDLVCMAAWELKQVVPTISTKRRRDSLFAPLADAIEAHERREFSSAAGLLGAWLKKKPYYTKSVVERFVDACLRSGEHILLKDVMARFSSVAALNYTVSAALFESYYASEQFAEALKIYNDNARILTSELHRRLAALCMLHARDYRKAESLLLKLHKELTGREFKLDYDAARKTWEGAIARIDELEAGERTEKESMSLGMAYLFSERYEDAIKMFEELRRAALGESQNTAQVRDVVAVP